VCLMEVVKTWWSTFDQQGVVEIWQFLQYNSFALNECLHIVSKCIKSPTNNTNTL